MFRHPRSRKISIFLPKFPFYSYLENLNFLGFHRALFENLNLKMFLFLINEIPLPGPK